MTLKVTQGHRTCLCSIGHIHYFRLVVCNNHFIFHRYWDITTLIMYVTDCHVENFFIFENVVEITSNVRFRIHIIDYCMLYFRCMGVIKTIKASNSKRDLRDHSRSLVMVPLHRHIRLPISVPLRQCLYLAPLTRYHLFPKNLNTSRDSEHIPLGIICHA